MNKKIFNFKGNRLVKKNIMEIKKNEKALNPLTLELVHNQDNKSIYFSKFYFENNKFTNITDDNTLKIDDNNTMLIPPILISYNEFLKLFEIFNIDDLLLYVNNNIDTITFNSINRIINCFIRDNFKNLSKNNKILIDIYLILFKKYDFAFSDEKNLNIYIEKFIIKWFRNNNSKSFFLNLGNDLEKFLSKKYES